MSLAVAPVAEATSQRILDATLACIRCWGVGKTTLDDVARVAGCSRATVYRSFPGGKESLLAAVGWVEMARLGSAVSRRMAAAPSLEDALTVAMAETGRRILTHPALQFLLAHEPETVVGWFTFRRGGEMLGLASALVGPYLTRWLAPDDARRAGEWAARVVLSYCFCPTPGVDMTDESSVRRLVTTFILPGLSPA